MPGFGLTDDIYDATPVVGGKPLFKETKYSFRFIDAAGKAKSFSFSIEGHEGFSRDEAEDLAEAMGESSNAGLVDWTCSEHRWINESDAFAYDEAYSSVEVQMTLVYQSNKTARNVLRISTPAPDLIMLADGVIDTSNGLFTNLRAKIEALQGMGDYSFKTVYIWDGRNQVHEPTPAVDVQEPGALDKPGPGPAGPV